MLRIRYSQRTEESILHAVDIARVIQPPIPTLRQEYVGDPKGTPANVEFDTSRSTGILGLKYRGIETIIRDTLAYFKERGWLHSA